MQMPIKAKAYKHQQEAYELACRLFGLHEGGDVQTSISGRGTAFLMEMLGNGDRKDNNKRRRGGRVVPR